MLFAPLEGWRRVEVPEQHAGADWTGVVGGCQTRTTPTGSG